MKVVLQVFLVLLIPACTGTVQTCVQTTWDHMPTHPTGTVSLVSPPTRFLAAASNGGSTRGGWASPFLVPAARVPALLPSPPPFPRLPCVPATSAACCLLCLGRARWREHLR